MPGACLLHARAGCDDGGGDRQCLHPDPPGAGAHRQGARLPVRVLHPWHRNVHVHSLAEHAQKANHGGYGDRFSRYKSNLGNPLKYYHYLRTF